MAYAIYETTDRLVVSAKQTQAAANAAVTTLGAGYATIEVDDGNSGHELPANFAPGFMYVTTGGVLTANPISGATLIKAWRDQIGNHARIFDLGIRREWAEGQSIWGTDGAIDAAETNLDRWINTMDWGRGWCGYVWRSVSLYEAIAVPTEAQTNTIKDLIEKLAAELPSVEHVEFWYHNHTAAWLGYRHQVWTTSALAGGAARIDAGAIPNNAVWNSNYIAQYHNALRYHVGAV